MHRPLALTSRRQAAETLGLPPGDQRLSLPPTVPGMRIGLFGGSFDPPHAGHLHVAKMALSRLDLHRIWWMVTPGNPLKRNAPPSDLRRRLEAATAFADHPRIDVTAFEARLAAPYTERVLDFLHRNRPGVGFVWMMGGDNLLSLHRWQNWRAIVETTPIAVIDRPGARLPGLRAKAAQIFAGARVDPTDLRLLATRPAPAWGVLTGPLVPHSSTRLRAEGKGL